MPYYTSFYITGTAPVSLAASAVIALSVSAMLTITGGETSAYESFDASPIAIEAFDQSPLELDSYDVSPLATVSSMEVR
jgi:hypothetical protein